MHRIILLAGTAFLLTACGSEPSEEVAIQPEEPVRGTYEIDENSGETTATITTPDGTATMRSGAEVPIDLPQGFTLYPDADVISNTRVEQGDGLRVVLLVFETTDTVEDVAAFYAKQAEDAQIEIEVDATINGARMIAGRTQDGSGFSLNASEEDGRTRAQLTTGLALSR